MPITILKAKDRMAPSNQEDLFLRYHHRYSGGKASGNLIMLRNTTKNFEVPLYESSERA